tara:strand:+ start:237 stop:356 length:120 start_codon:yes stop_codon:yes gene_type:complete
MENTQELVDGIKEQLLLIEAEIENQQLLLKEDVGLLLIK